VIVLLPTGVFELELLPPQPATLTAIPVSKATARTNETRHVCFEKIRRLRNAVRSPRPPIRASSNVFLCDAPTRGTRSSCTVATSVWMVNVEVAVPLAAGVMLIGLSEQVAFCGRPLQDKTTAWLKPFTEVAVTVAIPVAPWARVSKAGVIVIEKPGVVDAVTFWARALETELE